MFEFVTSGVLLTAVSLFGLVGNVVAIIVLSRPSMRGSFSTLLIGEWELSKKDLHSLPPSLFPEIHRVTACIFLGFFSVYCCYTGVRIYRATGQDVAQEMEGK